MASVEIGKRVLAPFRNKIVSGFVVGYPETDAVPENLREVIDIPDEPPYLTANLWRFICWISDYYLLPSGLVLRTALPPGSNRRSRPWAILTSDGRKRLGERDSESSGPAREDSANRLHAARRVDADFGPKATGRGDQ